VLSWQHALPVLSNVGTERSIKGLHFQFLRVEIEFPTRPVDLVAKKPAPGHRPTVEQGV
jgi:hypothetical protein